MHREKTRDDFLRIQTGSIGERANDTHHYHHYEATSYLMLDELFEAYELNPTGSFVDFGCGKGRVIFYVHHYFSLPVIGVEMNDQLYREALLNETSYLQHKKKVAKTIRIEHEFAEQYKIEKDEMTFFLFNPFSLQIFMKVIHNILRSVEEFPRTVDLILYYPADEYTDYLEMKTPFTLAEEVLMDGIYDSDEREKFMIYRYENTPAKA